jgi:hypothetical protein
VHSRKGDSNVKSEEGLFCPRRALDQQRVLAGGPGSKKIYAQKLVDDTLAKHKGVVIMAMHVTPPGENENVIIGSNIGRIGKKADEDDLRVIETGKPNLEVNKKGDHFEVELVLQDQSGKTIGAVGIVFSYEGGAKNQSFRRRRSRFAMR